MATSTPANANSPANISPVGPPPAITTACSVIATLRPYTSPTTDASRYSRFRRFWPAARDYAPRPGACRKSPLRCKLKWKGVGDLLSLLGVLEAADLVESRRDGRYKLHHLNTRPLEQIVDRWLRAAN